MKTKIAGLASTALLLLAPISGAFSAVAESQVVQAENNWDYDTADPGLGEYDRLLQNAGPSDGQIDWYPAEHFASSSNIRPSLLVKQLIDLSIATNNANSNARKVLFNDTTGVSKNSDYQDTYRKYNLALGFIAQLLAFNNEKTGRGAYLKQGFESDGETPADHFDDEDTIAETGKTPDDRIREIPAIGEGINISDVLGRAFFGNSDDAYAQLYVNGYDNTVQNAPNIIRETTTSITIVAQSKLTGRKATAIFKLNNKTFNNLASEVLLENNIDNSPSFGGGWGIDNIPSDEPQNYGDSTKGTFNQRANLVTGLTGDQKRMLSTGGSSAWVDPKTGSGTIVVPRGTSAAEIAKKIKQLGYKSNYNISNVAPMKAIHGDYFSQHQTGTLATKDNSYNVDHEGIGYSAGDPGDAPDNVTPLSNDAFDGTGKNKDNYLAVADPRLDETGNTSSKKLKANFSNSLLASPFNTNDTGAGGINNPYGNGIASQIPDQKDGNRDAFTTTKDIWPAYDQNNSTSATNFNQYTDPNNYGNSSYPFGGPDGAFGGGIADSTSLNPTKAEDKLGDVVHAFDPENGAKAKTSPFKVREAWDDTHAIFGTAPFTGLTEEEVKNQIANNGSFNNTSGDQIKKSFTFNMPLNNTVMKSYRNPYSTVISTALPFSKANPFNDGDSNAMNNSGFTGKYLGSDKPATNAWYANPSTTPDFESVKDTSGHKVNIGGSTTARSLHLNNRTWSNSVIKEASDATSTNLDGDKIGLYNVNKGVKFSTTSESNNTAFAGWVQKAGSSSSDDTYTGTDGDPLVGRVRTNRRSKPNNNPENMNDVIDAGNNNGFTFGRLTDRPIYKKWNGSVYEDHRYGVGETFPTVPDSERPGSANTWSANVFTNYESHLQLAKNIGYVLINAQNLSEEQQQSLAAFQIPSTPSSGSNNLDGIQNSSRFIPTNLPRIQPVNDGFYYRGGLLGVMSITSEAGPNETDDGSTEDKPRTQPAGDASSIYNNYFVGGTDPKYLKVPGYNGTTKAVKVDAPTGENPKGQFASDTDLHYGLAWNDSSDLPQVQINRSLNVQYLVPVSIARKVTTTWTQNNISSTRYEDYTRSVETKYSEYGLYLGNVKLANSPVPSSSDDYKQVTDTNSNASSRNVNNAIDVSIDTLSELLPVNNQIAYTQDKSILFYPHYDSELFDQGSNRKDVTVTRDDRRSTIVGTSEEKDSATEESVGSSDDYSIGIVKAPDELFKTANGIPTTPTLESRNLDGVESNRNQAASKEGMNKFADAPENNNGMSIRDPKSYATLAQAYNVEINGNKAVGKADDNAKNKGDRVALVQQLLDNGGNAEAYYYIPSLPRLYEHWNEARINVVVYDKAAVPAPSKAETKPSFSTTDVSTGNDPFNVNLRPYTTVYDDGAVLKASDVPQNFKNLLTRELVAGNSDLVTSDGKVATEKLQQILVGAFLNSWQQNDGSFNQTDTGVGVNSPLYLYGGFGISNSDSKNSYSQWPDGYTTPNLSSSKYHEAVTNYPGDFYRGGKDLKTTGATVIKGIPATALKADVSKVDLSKAGTYPVVYTYTNPSNDKDSASITVPVTVTDGAAPVFAFQGGSDLTIKVGESFDRSAFKVVGSWQIFNKYQGDYDKLVNYEGIAKNSKGEPDVTISGDVDTQTPGIYQLTYKATSIGGAVTTMKRNITVLPKETTGSDWKVSDFTSVGYINYVPNYGINVWNAPAGTFTGQRLTHGTSWKIFQRAVNSQGKVYYNVGKNQWIDGAYVSFTPVSAFQPLNGIVTINYVRGYGVNLWKAPKTTGGYYEGRKLQHGTKWKVFGIQDGFYKVGGNQWIQAKYAKFQAR